MRLSTRHTILSLALFGATASLSFAQAPVEQVPQPVQAVPGKLPEQKDPKKDDKKKDETKKADPKVDPLPLQNVPQTTNPAALQNTPIIPAGATSTAVVASSLPAVYGDAGAMTTYNPYLIATAPDGTMSAVPTGQTQTFPLGTMFSQQVPTQIVRVQTGTRVVFDPQTEMNIVIPVFENRLQVTGPPAIANVGGVPVNVIRGAFKIAENESPRPRDRFYYAFHYFSDVNPTLSVPGLPITNVQRHTIGLEKTFLDENASIGFRLPLLRTTGAYNIAAESIGDLSVIFKYALINEYNRNDAGTLAGGNVLSVGLVVTAPTGGNAAYTSNSPVIHSTMIQPWVGGTLVRGDLFLQGFSSIAAPTDDRDATYWFNSLQVGYQVFQAPQNNLLTSITPVLECHVNTPLDHRGLTRLPVGAIDVVSFTGGATFGLGSRSFINLGANVPVTGPKPYAVEAVAQVNFYW